MAWPSVARGPARTPNTVASRMASTVSGPGVSAPESPTVNATPAMAANSKAVSMRAAWATAR